MAFCELCGRGVGHDPECPWYPESRVCPTHPSIQCDEGECPACYTDRLWVPFTTKSGVRVEPEQELQDSFEEWLVETVDGGMASGFAADRMLSSLESDPYRAGIEWLRSVLPAEFARVVMVKSCPMCKTYLGTEYLSGKDAAHYHVAAIDKFKMCDPCYAQECGR